SSSTSVAAALSSWISTRSRTGKVISFTRAKAKSGEANSPARVPPATAAENSNFLRGNDLRITNSGDGSGSADGKAAKSLSKHTFVWKVRRAKRQSRFGRRKNLCRRNLNLMIMRNGEEWSWPAHKFI